jgi:hypothetical protein
MITRSRRINWGKMSELLSTDLDALKERITQIESGLSDQPFVVLGTFVRNGRDLHVCLTERLRQQCKKGKVWKAKPMLTALKNAQYGFDEGYARSGGGRDGIFIVDKMYYPPNAMMQKLFDHYLEKPGSGAEEVAEALEVAISDLIPVRLVSHHMRLLGVLKQAEAADSLVLVDFDMTKSTQKLNDEEE